MAKKTEEVVKATSTALSLSSVPEELQAYVGRTEGKENFEREDIILPRIALCQSMSPQRKKTAKEFIEGLEEGQFFNTVTSEIYGEGLQITPLFMYKTSMRFIPMEDGGGIECMSNDSISCEKYGTCECRDWKNIDGKRIAPPCTLFWNWMVMVYPTPEVAILSFKSTNADAARRLNSLIAARNLPSFAGVYDLFSLPDKANGQDFFIMSIKNAGWGEGGYVRKAEQNYTQYKKLVEAGRVKHDVDSQIKEEVAAEDTEFNPEKF
jgi:hypothetical protein